MLAPGSLESKVPLVVESRTTLAGGSLLLMPRSTMHALFGGTNNVLRHSRVSQLVPQSHHVHFFLAWFIAMYQAWGV